MPLNAVPLRAAETYLLLVRALYCAEVSGTTESLPSRTRGDSANSLLALICASVHGFAIGVPALILTIGTFGLDASAEITVAVPTALFRFPVS